MKIRTFDLPSALRNPSLRTKILMVFIPLLVIPLVLTGIIIFSIFTRAMESQAVSFSSNLLTQINRTVDAAILDLERLSLTPFTDAAVQEILRKKSPDNREELLRDTAEVDRMMSFMMILRNDIRGVFLKANNGGSYYKTSYILPIEHRIEQQPYYDEVLHSDGSKILLPTRDIEYSRNSREQVFSLVRLIKDSFSFAPVGVMQIDASVRILRSILEDTDVGEGSVIWIIDSHGALVYRTDNDPTPERAGIMAENIARFAGKDVTETHVIDGVETIAITKTSKYTGWTTVGLIPLDNLTKALAYAVRVMVAIDIVFLLLLVLMAVLLSRGITAPLYRLMAEMGNPDEEKFARVDLVQWRDRTDEVGQLFRSYERMMWRIDELIKNVYKAKLEKRDAELLALQSRINPHFLYNTLDTLRSMALDGETRAVADIAKTLGRLLRYGLAGEHESATVAEEMDNVRGYLSIQEHRFGAKLAYSLDIPAELLDARLPRLILQPLVENAVVHGIEPLDRIGTVTVSAVAENGVILIVVRDDGVGIGAERYRQLGRLIAEDAYQGQAFALRNVDRRLKLTFGKDYGLVLTLRPGGGVESSIRIPRNQE